MRTIKLRIAVCKNHLTVLDTNKITSIDTNTQTVCDVAECGKDSNFQVEYRI